MDKTALELKKYPIGKFERPETIHNELFQKWLASFSSLPERLEKVLENITADRLLLQYRPDSWTVQQIVHHIADSHVNGYIRLKWALTEDNPTIKAYHEKAWSGLADVREVDVKVSVELLKNLHHRWVTLVQSLNTAELKRTFYHPDNKVHVSVAEQTGLYAWHGEHHLAHIETALREG